MDDKPYEPGWVVNEKELMAKCPTCKARVPGNLDGLFKHIQKVHKPDLPEIRHETLPKAEKG